MKFKGYPKAYRRNTLTKLLYLYKTNIINREQWQKARFFNSMSNAAANGNLAEALTETIKQIKTLKDC